MHAVVSIVVHQYISLQSDQACITGLVDALSDHFTSFFFVTWERSLWPGKEVQSQAAVSITFSLNLAPWHGAYSSSTAQGANLEINL